MNPSYFFFPLRPARVGGWPREPERAALLGEGPRCGLLGRGYCVASGGGNSTAFGGLGTLDTDSVLRFASRDSNSARIHATRGFTTEGTGCSLT